jgi:hypothetical protein
MHTERFERLLDLLAVAAKSGVLTITPAETATAREWEAICLLEEGKVTACKMVRSRDQRTLLSGADALALLKQHQHLSWQLEEGLAHPGSFSSQEMTLAKSQGARHQQGQALYSPDTIPQRTLLGLQRERWARLPRELRHVLLLVDGQRSCADITRLLSAKSCKQMGLLLDQLREEGFIE